MSHEQWTTSRRDRMLEALKVVLEQIPGVQHVDRQDLDPEGTLPEARLPAIIIDEERTRYDWTDRHGDREMNVQSGLVLDLQAQAPRSGDRAGYQISTVRELFVQRVLEELADEATLTVELDGESSPTPHADDTLLGAEVRYPAVEPPKTRAIISLTVWTDETFDGRVHSTWTEIAADIYSHDDADDPPDFTAGD